MVSTRLKCTGIKSWPADERPREKLLRNGEHRLSDAELLAILLRTGLRGLSALGLARSILQKFKSFRAMSHTDPALWKEFKGLGPAKLAQIKAAIEIGRRMEGDSVREELVQISSSADAVKRLMPKMRDLKIEVFKVILLNGQNRILHIFDAAEGTVNFARPIIRELFQKALQHYAAAMICAHNHPSGQCQPSQDDRRFTEKLCRAGDVLQVKVLDHLIIGDNVYYSFADEGLIS